MATYLGPSTEFEGVAAADLASGDLVFDPSGRAGVVATNSGVKSGSRYRASSTGRYGIPSASGTTFAADAIVYWDATAGLAVAADAGDGVIGRALKAKIAGETSVEVELNGQGPAA